MRLSLVAICLLMASAVSAQKYFTKQGEVSFTSDASLEKIEAVNHKATSVVDTETGAVQWSVLIKAFAFEKALMEEHFNENYMESSKFPKGVFKGKLTDPSQVDFKTNGTYEADVTGNLEIHGVKKEVTSKATFVVSKKGIQANSIFEVALADYEIEIPSVVADNISKVVQISVKANYELLDK